MEISLTRIEYRKNSYLLGFSLVPLIAASLLPMKASSASPVRRTLLGGHFAPSSEMRRTLSRRPSCHAKSTAAAGTRAAKETHNVDGLSPHQCTRVLCHHVLLDLWLHQPPPKNAQWEMSRWPLKVLHHRVLLDLWLHHFPPESAKYQDGHWQLQCTRALHQHFCGIFDCPVSTRKRTVSRWPLVATTHRGVAPPLAARSLAAPASTIKRTVSRWPLAAATRKGVAPVCAV